MKSGIPKTLIAMLTFHEWGSTAAKAQVTLAPVVRIRANQIERGLPPPSNMCAIDGALPSSVMLPISMRRAAPPALSITPAAWPAISELMLTAVPRMNSADAKPYANTVAPLPTPLPGDELRTRGTDISSCTSWPALVSVAAASSAASMAASRPGGRVVWRQLDGWLSSSSSNTCPERPDSACSSVRSVAHQDDASLGEACPTRLSSPGDSGPEPTSLESKAPGKDASPDDTRCDFMALSALSA
mmetsp:Transcript_16486/g.51236  ORF Transcript_16486/g.51236 Transcript_16486/m.51236 type:complete len:244 (+) Transcript_16486:896-1627(+)